MNRFLKALNAAVILVFLYISSFGQITGDLESASSNKNQLTVKMQRLAGTDPRGDQFTTTGTKENYPIELKQCIPAIKGTHSLLKNTAEYFVILNHFQFFFQAYTTGKITKEYFVKEANNFKWNLEDTLYLSREPIRCGVQVVTGLDEQDQAVAIIDVNGNNDFSDEPIKPLPPSPTRSSYGIPIPIAIDFLEKGQGGKRHHRYYLFEYG